MVRQRTAWGRGVATALVAAGVLQTGCADLDPREPLGTVARRLLAGPPAADVRLASAQAQEHPDTFPILNDPIPDAMPIDLLTALRLCDTSNPTVAIARARAEAAYQRLREAELAWLPDLRTGPAYQRHDGLIQNARGEVFKTNKWNLFMGGGAFLHVDTGEAYFGPLVARRLADAQRAQARAVNDDVQLDVALAYLDLFRVYAQLAINADTLAHAEEMRRNAESAERAGLGKTPADVTRARTEVELRRQDRIDLQGQAATASARLARLLLLDPTVDLRPADPTVVALTLVDPAMPLPELVGLGVANRPETRESRFLAGAAETRWRQARVAPLLPRLEVGYSAGEFSAGRDDNTEGSSGRGDGSAQATWELHNLGAGDVARARARRAESAASGFHVREVESRVAEDVTVAAKWARARADSLASARSAVEQAQETWRRLREAAFGMAGTDRRYDPLEPLIAERDLDLARTRFLNEVIEYNKAEFRLFWALGQPPVCAVPKASPVPNVTPSPAAETLPPPRPQPDAAK